jgi:hypothetical protein
MLHDELAANQCDQIEKGAFIIVLLCPNRQPPIDWLTLERLGDQKPVRPDMLW